MKLTKKKLKDIITEELGKLVSEIQPLPTPDAGGPWPETGHERAEDVFSPPPPESERERETHKPEELSDVHRYIVRNLIEPLDEGEQIPFAGFLADVEERFPEEFPFDDPSGVLPEGYIGYFRLRDALHDLDRGDIADHFTEEFGSVFEVGYQDPQELHFDEGMNIMKISRNRLMQIIKEEVSKAEINEFDLPMVDPEYPDRGLEVSDEEYDELMGRRPPGSDKWVLQIGGVSGNERLWNGRLGDWGDPVGVAPGDDSVRLFDSEEEAAAAVGIMDLTPAPYADWLGLTEE